MGALRQIKPALQFSEGRSKPWSGSLLVNAFSEKADGDKSSDFAIMAIPGLVLFADVGDSPIRGVHQLGDLLYVVSGELLYSVSQGGDVVEIGTIIGSDPVRMVDNGTQLAIAAAPRGYVYSDEAIVDPEGLPQVSDVAYIDSYFVWSVYDSDQCIYSGVADGLSYDALDVFTAEGSPDGLKGLIASHRELLLAGSVTLEVFYNSGGADNAFERQGNAFVERGIFDRDSLVNIDNSVQFMGDDRIVYRLDGYTPVRISTHSIEYQLRAVTYARAFAYTQEGHKFYVLSTDNGTFCYDLATGAWHERKSWQRGAYRASTGTVAWGDTIFGGAYTGRLYRPDMEVNTEDGEIISVEIELPELEASRARVTMYQFEVYCESGVGLNDGQGSDPQIMMRYSDDGGRLWSNELWRSLGKIGEYRTRAIWRSLGQFRQRTMRLTITDPVRRLIMAYYADIR